MTSPETTTTRTTHDGIEDIINRYELPGEELVRAFMDGGPNVYSATEAVALANWLDSEADGVQGYDPRHRLIADEIRRASARFAD